MKAFLFREFGIGGSKLTADDLTTLARTSVQRAGAPDGVAFFTPSGAAFARGSIIGDAMDFAARVNAFIAGAAHFPIRVTSTPDVLTRLGLVDRDIYITPRVLQKVLRDKHALPANVVKAIPRELHDPVAVFDSATEPGSLVILTSQIHDGKPVVVAIVRDVAMGRQIVHSIATMHPREFDATLEKWVADGRLDYVNESKRPAWWTTGDQTSIKVGPTAQGAVGKILTEVDFVKPAGGDTKGPQAPAFSRAAAIPEWVASGSAALKSAASKIDTFAPQKAIKEKVRALAVNWKERLVQGMFDAYAPLKRLGRSEYIKARMAKSSDGVLEGMLLYGKPIMGIDGAIHGDIDMKGFLGAMQELKGEHDRFFMWVAGNRAARLAGEDKEHLFTADEIAAMRNLNAGSMKDGSPRAQAYAKAFMVLRDYNKSVLDIAERTGLIDGSARHLWEHDFYVPFFRVGEDMKIDGPASKVKGLVRQQAFKKLKGGEENLGDLMQNTLQNWSHILSASMANQAAVANLKAAEKIGIAAEVPADTKGATYAMVDGKKTHYEVSDPFILQAISAMESASFKGLPMAVMSKFKHYLTLGVTAGPPYRIRNLLRDSISAIGQNEMSYNVMQNVVQGWKGTDRKSADYAQMMFGGALMRFGQLTEGKHAEHVKRLIAAGVDDDTILTSKEKVKAALAKLWDEWQEFGDKMENINRTALYKQLKTKGMSDAEAAFAARDMMDFRPAGLLDRGPIPHANCALPERAPAGTLQARAVSARQSGAIRLRHRRCGAGVNRVATGLQR